MSRLWVDAGLLMAYVANTREQGRRGAWYVARILEGANPAELPIELTRAYDLLMNRNTLSTLGLTLPPHIESQVAEWVE